MNFSGLSNRSLVGKILRQPLKLIPDQAAMPILQGRLRGKKWIAGAHVYAFEPLPRNIHFLKEHLRINRVSNVEIIQAAVGEVNGETFFDDTTGSAMGRLSPEGKLKVRTVSIDELIAAGQLQTPHCLKIDVEGAEADVLAGAETTLKAFHPKIFLATHGLRVHQECCDLLKSSGYQLNAVGSIS